MSILDDLLAKKKAVAPVLDLNKSIIQSSDEFKKVMEKVPEYKMRPIKVRIEEIKTKEKDYSFKLSRKAMRKLLRANGEWKPTYFYTDPVPEEMKEVVLADLCSISIDWKMLTTLRPKSKQGEELFTRMVEMGKLQLKTEARDRRDFATNHCVRKLKNKSGIVETRLQTCAQCGEEMCAGRACTKFNYDLFSRVEIKLPKAKPVPNVSSKKKCSGPKKPTANSTKSKSKKTHNKVK